MTIQDAAPLPLAVSLHTLDPEQRPETVELLAGSSVKVAD